jgi:hypothetical protein
MRLLIKSGILVSAISAAACGQGSPDNVMAPEANALEPAEINAALGPEVANLPDSNIAANDINAVDNGAGVPDADEPPAENSAE